jgi:hypothetical protein
MNRDQPVPPEIIRQLKRKNRLWLLVVPPLLSLALIALAKPAGRSASAVELAIIGLCSLICGFALGVKSFETSRQRIWGGLVFSSGSLCLVGFVVFLGCGILNSNYRTQPMTPAQIENMKRQQEAFRQQQEKQTKERVAAQIVPRDAAADSSLLDLSAFYNQLLPGQRLQTDASRSYLKPGIHTWQGIKFDVRGEIESGWNDWDDSDPIPVGQKCMELDFLLGESLLWPANFTNCQFVIHFANGINETIPIVYDKDVSSSSFSEVYPRNSPALTNSVVWGESVYANAPIRPLIGFYIKRWINPFPDAIVTAIDFMKVNNKAGAFLVAITLQPTQKENQ